MPPLVVDYPVTLPTEKVPPETDAVAVANTFLPNFASFGPEHLDENGIWRDVYTLTGTLRTFYGASSVSAAWKETSEIAQPGSFSVDPKTCQVVNLGGDASLLQAAYTFETAGTPKLHCTAIAALVPDPERGWRIWTLRTILDQLQDQKDVDVLEPVSSVAELVHGSVDEINNGVSKLTNGFARPTHFDCVVIGGGQAGLSVGGRLKALDINYVVLDKHNEVGDSWKTRYTSARLHTVREYAHLPFDRTFPAHYPEWLSKDDLAQGYRDWVSKFGINVWQKSKVISGDWDPSRKLWTLTLVQDGQTRFITCSHAVIAGGGGGQSPEIPQYPGRDTFRGMSLHSVSYMDAKDWKGKRGVVVGTANTAHDIADDMLAAQLSEVTMVQRSKTYIVPIEFYERSAHKFYNASIPTALADKMDFTQPYAVQDLMTQGRMHAMARQEPERFDALERAGFKTERYGSLTDTLYNRMGGHYMDVGTSAKIAKGLIKMKSDSLPIRYTPDGLEFEDGTELKADVIVFATGFKNNMKYMAEEIFGPEVAEKMGDFWTLDKEGELKGAFKPCGHPNLWYHGGVIGHARLFSRYLALQIKADLLGTPLPVYRKTP